MTTLSSIEIGVSSGISVAILTAFVILVLAFTGVIDAAPPIDPKVKDETSV